MPLNQIEVLLGTESGKPPRRSNGPEPRLFWLTDQALADSQGYQQAVRAYRRGQPVAVLRGATSESTDRALHGAFGVASPAALAVYVRSPDGAPHLHTVNQIPEAPEARQGLARQLVTGIADSHRVAAQASALADDTAQKVALPKVLFLDTQYAHSGNGASVTLKGEVLRDSSPSAEALVVSAMSLHNLKPHHNGQSGNSVIVPGNYHYFLRLSTPDNRNTLPQLAQARPLSDPSTNLNVETTNSRETRYGFGTSREISGGLEGKVPSFGAKIAFSFDFSRTNTTSHTLAFSVKDYSIAASAAEPLHQTAMAYWDMPLAPLVANTADYFGSNPTPTKMTPSMVQVSAEGAATWVVPGNFDNTLNISAGGRIDNKGFTGRKIENLPDPRVQPTAAVSVRADSAYLTREPTVFIQSKAGNGGCLRDDNGVVRIAPCPDVANPHWIEDLAAQWQLDDHGRYYNRGSSNCMQILLSGTAPGGSGEIITSRCSTNRDQRWEWQADRIHTLHGDGHPLWRIFVGPGNIVGVRTTNTPEYQDIPINPYHALLAPWSSYPSKPGSSDFIPRLDAGRNEPVSEEVKRLDASPAGERWELIVLRQSLHR